METLIHLVQRLKPKETQLIRDFYQLGHANSTQNNKRLRLFEMLLAEQVHNDQEACQALYERPAGSAWCQLKKRLQQDILNIMLLTPFSNVHHAALKKKMDCYKSFLMGQVLIQRGLLDEGVHTLEKTSSQAQACELLSVQLSCDDTLRSLQTDSHQSYGEKINRSLDNFKDLLQAKEFYFTTTHSPTLSPKPVGPDERLKLLENRADRCHSRKATFWYTMALVCCHQQAGNLTLAKSLAFNLLSDSPPCLEMLDEQEKTALYLQVAQILIGLREPQNAIQPAKQAVRCAQNNRTRILTALQTLFRAHFQVGNWQQAEAVWCQARQEQFQDCKEEAGAWFFLKSCLLSIQHKYQESTRYLLSHEDTIDRQSELILWAKLLELTNILEVADFDWFEFKLESFRKRLSRSSCSSQDRILLLFRLFNSLKRHDYNYRTTRLCEHTLLALLGDDRTTSACQWNPLSYELINHYDRFINRANQ